MRLMVIVSIVLHLSQDAQHVMLQLSVLIVMKTITIS